MGTIQSSLSGSMFFYLLSKMVSGCRTFESPCDTNHTCMNSRFVNILMLVKNVDLVKWPGSQDLAFGMNCRRRHGFCHGWETGKTWPQAWTCSQAWTQTLVWQLHTYEWTWYRHGTENELGYGQELEYRHKHLCKQLDRLLYGKVANCGKPAAFDARGKLVILPDYFIL